MTKSDPAASSCEADEQSRATGTELAEPRSRGRGECQSAKHGPGTVPGNHVTGAEAHTASAKGAKGRRRSCALFHYVSLDHLEEAFLELKENAAPGVDGLTCRDYEQHLGKAQSRGPACPRPSGAVSGTTVAARLRHPSRIIGQRPIAVAALEDKIVQRATAAVLSAIYEEDFLGFSFGFRPGRSTHDAMDALLVGITSTKVNWILDADIRSFFDTVSQEWLIKFVEHRVGDRRIIRLIQKWLKAGILEDGIVTVSDKGTGQGSVILTAPGQSLLTLRFRPLG